ncbi:MAG: TIGR00730 family Rossman fold protein [Bacteroidales bacterium]|nr:TIGR00730 family Rossman fold protein [Bacteroidales bacterium]
MKSIAVYCGSSSGNNEIYRVHAAATGRFLARQKIDLVYGGGKVGLMGVLADAAMEAGGKVIGIIPGFLQTKEVAHDQLSELITVETMHQRKALIHEMSDGFMALPGGYGTLEELFEILTWGQLGLHPKPVGLLNIAGFFDHLLSFLDQIVQEGFLHEINRNMVLTGHTPEDLLEQMVAYQAPTVPKWL